MNYELKYYIYRTNLPNYLSLGMILNIFDLEWKKKLQEGENVKKDKLCSGIFFSQVCIIDNASLIFSQAI